MAAPLAITNRYSINNSTIIQKWNFLSPSLRTRGNIYKTVKIINPPNSKYVM
jgi:hypothetical protein